MLSWINSPKRPEGDLVFLDRDGVINIDQSGYIKHWSEFRFFPDSLEALKMLAEARFDVILISNQSGLNRGLIRWDDFWGLHNLMIQTIRDAGGDILAAFYCPHRPDENCSCRKPSPEMILTAARIYHIPLQSAYMIGDRGIDIEAGKRAGCMSILLDRSVQIETQGGDFPLDENCPRHYTLLESAAFLIDGAQRSGFHQHRS